jgi:hypothetical protein
MTPLTHSTRACSHEAFLPCYRRVRALARRAFRAVRCPQTRDDLAAEAAALAWRLFARRPSNPDRVARRAVALAKAGRTLCALSG